MTLVYLTTRTHSVPVTAQFDAGYNRWMETLAKSLSEAVSVEDAAAIVVLCF